MRILWRLFGYVKPYVLQLAVAAVLLAFAGALMAAVVSTAKPLVNDVLLPGVTGQTAQVEQPALPAPASTSSARLASGCRSTA